MPPHLSVSLLGGYVDEGVHEHRGPVDDVEDDVEAVVVVVLVNLQQAM